MTRPQIERTCLGCGKKYLTRGFKSRFCPDCQAKRMKDYFREYKEKKRKAKPEKPKDRICPYCGKKTDSFSGYCKLCSEYGLDMLHRTFGKTNGWDAPKKTKPVPVKDGWRGNMVAGGGPIDLGDFNPKVY